MQALQSFISVVYKKEFLFVKNTRWLFDFVELMSETQYQHNFYFLCRQLVFYTGPTGLFFKLVHFFCYIYFEHMDWYWLFDFSYIWNMYLKIWNYSWESSECDFWQCNRVDNLIVCNEARNVTTCSTVIVRVNFVQFVACSWMCAFQWWNCSSE